MKVSLDKRIFVGFPVSRKIARTIPLLQSTIPDKKGIIRWLSGKNIHLTLSFLGNIAADRIPELIECLKEAVKVKYFNITIEGTGVYPSPSHPRILWLGVNEGSDELITLHIEVEKRVKKFKDNPKKVKFTPHITIARVWGLKREIDFIPFMNTVYSPIEFDVNSIYLYESQLVPEGAQYTILAEFPLN